MTLTIPIAISSCLIGQNVRYDGKHKLQAWLESVAGVEWIPICPELEAGMPVPREKIQIELHDGERMLMAIESRQDWSAKMDSVADDWIEQLQIQNVCGYVFKSRSPSCGVQDVPVYGGISGEVMERGQGRFAQRVHEAMPKMPLVEETQMESERLRKEFFRQARIFQNDQGFD